MDRSSSQANKIVIKSYGVSGQGDALVYSVTVRGLCVHEMVLHGDNVMQVPSHTCV